MHQRRLRITDVYDKSCQDQAEVEMGRVLHVFSRRKVREAFEPARFLRGCGRPAGHRGSLRN